MAKPISIEIMEEEDVYDLSVEEHYNYFANNIVVHNCMQLSKTLAGFTDAEANRLRKSIGKKLAGLMAEMKSKFIEGAKRTRVATGEISEKEVETIWGLIEVFAGYGFCKCLTLDTTVEISEGTKLFGDLIVGDKIKAPKNLWVTISDVIDSGEQQVFDVTLNSGKKISCTMNHKFLCANGKVLTLAKIIRDGLRVVCDNKTGDTEVITRLKCLGTRKTRNITVESEDHCFFANGIATSNSHAIAYSALSCAELWLKYNYFVPYMTALVNNTPLAKKKFGSGSLLVSYLNYCRRWGTAVLPPSINHSGIGFTIENQNQIRFGLDHVKGVANSAQLVIAVQPFSSLEDFLNRTEKRKVNKKVVEALIASGAFDEFGTRNDILQQFYSLRKEKELPPTYSENEWINLEMEMIGLCLSKPPLLTQYADLIKQNRWCPIGEAGNRGRTFVFGRINSITERHSKAGNFMYLVELSDDIDTMSFFVFSRSIPRFNREIKKGYVVAIPLNKFDDDSATRFYNAEKDTVVVKR